jgi:Dolichyl-phosphate-mannose-protein mannosyltransferase
MTNDKQSWLSPRIALVAAGFLCVVVSVGSAAMVMPGRSIWVDETTQMSGLAGNPIEITQWLMGRIKYNTNLQDDRMPPLSYWAGWFWSRIFGLGERQMRWFSVFCTGVATAFVFKTAEKAWGLAAGLAAGLLFALSPNVIDRAIGIRCYALFMLTASMTFYFLTRLLRESNGKSTKWIIGMTISSVAAMYTHFYGLILAGSCLSAALILFYLQGKPVRSVVAAMVLIGVASSGLFPFIAASVDMSKEKPSKAEHTNTDRIRATAQWGYRQFFHASISASRMALIAGIAGFVLCCGVAVQRTLNQRTADWVEAAGIGMALASGSAIILIAQFVVKSFVVTQPNYSVWMLPGWAIFLASAVRGPRISRTSVLGLTLLLGAECYGTIQMARRGEVFSPAPAAQIARMISEYKPDQVVVVYEGDRDPMLYFPITFIFNNNVGQYIYRDGSLTSYPPSNKVIAPMELPANTVVVVRSADQSAAELVGQLDRASELSPGPVASTLMESPQWKLIDNKVFLSFIKADVRVFRRIK